MNGNWEGILERKAMEMMEVLGRIVLYLLSLVVSVSWRFVTKRPLYFFVLVLSLQGLHKYHHEKKIRKATKLVVERIAKHNISGGLAACLLWRDFINEYRQDKPRAKFILAHWEEIVLRVQEDVRISTSWGFFMKRKEKHFVFLHPAVEGNTVEIFGSLLKCDKVWWKMPDGTSIHRSKRTRPRGSALKTSPKRQTHRRVKFVDRDVEPYLRTKRTTLTEEWTI